MYFVINDIYDLRRTGNPAVSPNRAAHVSKRYPMKPLDPKASSGPAMPATNPKATGIRQTPTHRRPLPAGPTNTPKKGAAPSSKQRNNQTNPIVARTSRPSQALSTTWIYIPTDSPTNSLTNQSGLIAPRLSNALGSVRRQPATFQIGRQPLPTEPIGKMRNEANPRTPDAMSCIINVLKDSLGHADGTRRTNMRGCRRAPRPTARATRSTSNARSSDFAKQSQFAPARKPELSKRGTEPLLSLVCRISSRPPRLLPRRSHVDILNRALFPLAAKDS